MQINFVIGRKGETAPRSSIPQRASEAQAALDARMRGEPNPTAAKEQPWWYLLLAALFMFGFSGLAARGSIGIAIVCGVAGLAALFAANKRRLNQGAAAKVKRTGPLPSPRNGPSRCLSGSWCLSPSSLSEWQCKSFAKVGNQHS